ncbi:MAG: polyphosphate kinase 2 family protein [Ignavibacteria bacterium]|nr:polyphosphate kinase 2 family protein [Bacteroidota bacterium]MBL7128851.1 polyphosphate kinase 2 family protein [Ignavibacteria bacterium]
MKINNLKVPEGKKIKLKDYKTDVKDIKYSKDEAEELLKEHIEELFEYQAKLYAYDKYALLIVFQAMDAAGKDGAIKHIMSGLNPQGTQVFSFKQPSAEELDHDYLWRVSKSLPRRGHIGIFNRSHYEDVLIVRVHNLLDKKKVPPELIDRDIWKERYRQIRDFEKYIFENGIIPIKFFLHISKEEQRKRFLKRANDPAKNWKISSSDLNERGFWDDYQKCYEDAISATSTNESPWYIIPSDTKRYARLIVSEIILKTFKSLNLEYPKPTKEQLDYIDEYRRILNSEEE